MKKMTVLLLMAALGCAALSGCGSDDTSAGSASAEAELSTEESTELSTDESTDESTDGSTDSSTDGSTDSSTNGSTDGSTDESTDGSAQTSTENTGTSASGWADGTYTATAAGYESDFEVTVTIEGGVITAVTCGDNEESDDHGALAIRAIPNKIVIAQSAEVDAVTGATATSEAIINAVAECLEEASN